MTNLKRAFWATTALVGGVLAATAASAQSTGSTTFEDEDTVEEVVVTGYRATQLPSTGGTTSSWIFAGRSTRSFST